MKETIHMPRITPLSGYLPLTPSLVQPLPPHLLPHTKQLSQHIRTTRQYIAMSVVHLSAQFEDHIRVRGVVHHLGPVSGKR